MRRLGLALTGMAIVAAACGSPSPPTVVAPASPIALSTVGQFSLGLTLPKLVWKAGEPVSGTATLRGAGSSPLVLVGAGSGLIVFDFAEVVGQRRVLGVSTADCAPHPLAPGAPMIAPITVSAGFDPANPSDTWLSRAMSPGTAGAELPPGTWDVTARATFYEGTCGGASYTITATVRITVSG